MPSTREQDPADAAKIDVAYVSAGILTADEVRAKMGLGALPKVAAVGKYNNYHVPAGSPEGGQFTTAEGAGVAEASSLHAGIEQDTMLYGDETDIAQIEVLIDGMGALEEAGSGTLGRTGVAETAEGAAAESAAGEAASNEAKPQTEENVEWKLGNYKSAERWQNQMKDREWTDDEITDTIKSGEQSPAPNYVNKGNTATRYTNPDTGKFIVRDNVTKEIIQLGKKGYEPNKFPTK